MTDIVVTPAQVAAVDPKTALIQSYIAGVAITKGQAVYIASTGKLGVCETDQAGKQQFRGIALNAGGIGAAIDVLHEGLLYGFTVSALNADVLVYASNTAGALADANGTMTVPAGRVVCLPDKSLTKVIHIAVRWLANWT